MIFVDSNVVIDLLEENSAWSEWSRGEVLKGVAADKLMANLVVLAECAGHFGDLEEGLCYFEDVRIELMEIPAAAAFRAGAAHKLYRRSGGQQRSILADFLIGAHASALGARLLTRDRQRFVSYFPELTLITPETDNG
ncbi:MAG: type II toxin-antitoxin system VapC family toxin [Candidatus Sphingomonas phytovorans]|nr:type II toxin-antitoxin system VapC family toxin [Sphingomonas sp.]WEK01656.1 MAG: type II toxin-antitoxin system VapC family toxin [Sphingomonas sp.]